MTQIQASFDRVATVKVFKRQQSGNVLSDIDKTGTAFSSRMDDGSPGFRISFQVQKCMGPAVIPNLSTVTIYNLGSKSRETVSGLNNLLVLEAGYGNNPEVIFRGNISHAITVKRGADYVTTMNAGDGLFASQNSLINKSFDKGVTVQSTVDTLIDSMKGAGVEKGVVQGVPSASYNQGVVLSGKAMDRLREVCERHDLNFSIQDGKVTIVPYGSNIGNTAYVYNPDTGLVGIPDIRSFGYSPDGVVRPQISFKVLLNPKIGVFNNVIIQSKFINGAFVTTKVTQDGDSWSGPWFTSIEAFQPQNSTVAG